MNNKAKEPEYKINDFKNELKDDIKDSSSIDINEQSSKTIYTIETPYSILSIVEYPIEERITYNKYNKSQFSVQHYQAIETYSETSNEYKKRKGFPNSYYYDIIKTEVDKLKTKKG